MSNNPPEQPNANSPSTTPTSESRGTIKPSRRASYTKVSAPLSIPRGVRKLKPYTIFDSDFYAMGAQSWFSALFFSLAAGLYSFIVGAEWDYAMLAEATATQTTTKESVIGLCWPAFFVCLALGIIISGLRVARVYRIKKDHVFEMDVQSGN